MRWRETYIGPTLRIDVICLKSYLDFGDFFSDNSWPSKSIALYANHVIWSLQRIVPVRLMLFSPANKMIKLLEGKKYRN